MESPRRGSLRPAAARIASIRLGRAPNCSSLGNVVNVLVWSQAAVAALWVAAEGWRARRTRPEPDGGESRAVDDPPALVRTEPSTLPGRPHEAHLQLTAACPLPCPSCHVDPSRDGAHVPLAVVEERLARLAGEGVFHVAVGGGEALSHPDLPAVAAAARAHGLSIGLTTSGVGHLDNASGFDQVNVSLDGLGESFRVARGYDGATRALDAIRRLSRRQRVGVNIVLTRESFPYLGQTVAAALEAGARDVHLLRLKPAGRAAETYAATRLTGEQALALWPTLVALIAAHPEATFRVDCAMTPWLAAHGVDVERMRAFGWTGCHGGEAVVAVRVDGVATPCSFVSEPLTEGVRTRWHRGVEAEPCRSCAWREPCRGGCHAVAVHLAGDAFAPDPECPIVQAQAASHAMSPV